MCFGEKFGPSAAAINDLYREINEVISSLQFIFWTNGVTLPIILFAGFILNITCLIVIRSHRRKSPPGSSPYSLLQCLIVCDLLIMALSIYSDVEPAIRARVSMSEIRDIVVPDCKTLLDLKARLGSLRANNESNGLGLEPNSLGVPKSNLTVTYNATGDEKRNPSLEKARITLTNDDLMLLLLYSMLSENKNGSPSGSTLNGDMRSSNDDFGNKNTFLGANEQYVLEEDPSKGILWNASRTPAKTIYAQNSTIKKVNSSTANTSDISTSTISTVTPSTISPLQNITINSRPIIQTAERWVAYCLMTFNLGLTLTLTLERLFAIRFPFRVFTLLTSRCTSFTVLLLVTGTLGLHTPQFVREIVMATDDVDSLKDDFQGKMIQVNVTTIVLVLVVLQTPQAVAMIVLTCMSLQDLVSHTAAFTRAVILARLLYVTNSALAHGLTYCLMARDFRRRLSHQWHARSGCCNKCRGGAGSGRRVLAVHRDTEMT
ncbi:hypothetical protein ElyMa_005017900 [Elysia marginata]|uniref:G-protein coupled receptors family 1 profile domain-containing protein n=1 Tax=Elysia marginata TaxID=1093978 RepID=A0AAV4J7Y2_9GAST|nr:hypothetical protein ElyMa_005017900 [Elysia marginata]